VLFHQIHHRRTALAGTPSARSAITSSCGMRRW
jgi:hypothetical protein